MTRNTLCLTLLAALALPALCQTHGIDPSALDRSIKPGNDFFHFANGNWIARHEIPADRTSIGLFATLRDQSDHNVATLLEEAARSNPAPGTPARRVSDLYASYMNESAIESRGTKPIQAKLDVIAAIKTPKELAHALGETLEADVDALNNTNFSTPNLFGLWVAPGFNDPSRYAPYLLQGGLSLPNRDYYLADTERMKKVRAAYQAHIAAMLKLAGFPDAEARAARVYALEHAIAEKHQSLADNEDIHKANNTWTMADFTNHAPGLDWSEYFNAAGLSGQPSFIVWQPATFTAEAALVAATPIDTWKDYLAFHYLGAHAPLLPRDFSEERFALRSALTGATQQQPRNLRGIALVNNQLGDDVGQLYAARFFTPEARARVQALVANLIAAFRVRIDGLTWMAPATKAEAQQKLTTLVVSVGYPDHWRSYAGYDPRPDDLIGNFDRGSAFDYQYQLKRLGTTVDRHEWTMEPQTVNAVNLPLHNALNFPAAILQPPFFDPQAPDAVNYGAIGAIIGHEISHTFDSEGAAFDSTGRVRNWWTPEDLAHFEASTAKLAAQYDQYKPFPDLAVNGRQTLGENIADVAGLTAAYEGYKAALKDQPAPIMNGFTGDQQFFLAFARNYESKSREASLRSQVTNDPHSPSQYRATTVRNLDPWYPAFDVKPGDTLYLAPPDRVHIW